MNPDQIVLARNSDAYPPARLVREAISGQTPIALDEGLSLSPLLPPTNWHDAQSRAGFSSLELDHFHGKLLNSEQDEEVLQSLLSVVFWGYVAGADGSIRTPYARARVGWLCHGKKGFRRQPPSEQIARVKAARDLLKPNRVGDALLQTMKIQHVGMSFASKIVTFRSPELAGIYDDVISERLASLADERLRSLGGMAKSSNRRRQAETYTKWCDWLRSTAGTLNATDRRWRDWDGAEHSWRAVDAERAFFALGRLRSGSPLV